VNAIMRGLLLERVLEGTQRLFAEEHHANFLNRAGLVEKSADFADGDLGGLVHGIAVDAGADRGESDGLQLTFGRKLQAFAVAGRELVGLSLIAAPIYGTDGMENVLSFQPSGFGDNRFAGLALAHPGPNAIQLSHDAGTSGTMNGAIHPGSAREPRIGRIYDCVGLNERDIALFEHYHFTDIRFPKAHAKFYRFGGDGLWHNEKPLAWQSIGFPSG
jgi:hypothetical protein